MRGRTTKEPQNQEQIDAYQARGPVRLGPWSSHLWRTDPKHLGFTLSRYKFCARMLAGKRDVLEVGCGDGLGMMVVLETVASVHGCDFEPLVIEDARARLSAEGVKGCSLSVLDFTRKTLERSFDAAYSLDVIEHIPPALEDVFMDNLCRCLRPHAVCILGTPNREARRHASPASQAGHVNLKDAASLSHLLAERFHNVFLFSMNDEVVHTGFYPMAHYLLGVAAGVKGQQKGGDPHR
ncbi:MAG: class I SAM-dependent methyltransferase [Acidobacteriota bacterium]